MSILVIAPHADDETLGMGGTIAKYANEKEIHLAILTGPGKQYHPFLDDNLLKTIREESKRALKVLGIKNVIYKELPPVTLSDKPIWELNKTINQIITSLNPEIIYIPYKNDLHVDHKAISYATNVSCRPYLDNVSNLKRVLAYETLSETNLEYVSKPFVPNVYEDISNTIDKKLKALACYKSQLQARYRPRTIETIKALGTLRGSHIGTSSAEGFLLLAEYIR
tara:strand:+ start:515 stop:1186 length:672 start_codon:yes stop_codon:yes gene_type:complete